MKDPQQNPWDDPGHEQLVSFELGLAEGFRADRRDDIVRAVSELLGPPAFRYDGHYAGDQSQSRERIRGGPHIMGNMGWIGWTMDADIIRDRLDLHEPAKTAMDAFETATFQINWAENLPFMVGLVRMGFPSDDSRPPPNMQYAAQYLVDELFDVIPGRLSPNNRQPRAMARWLLAGKTSEKRMKRLLDAAAPGDGEGSSKALRAALAGLPLVERDPGRIRFYSPYPNIVILDGNGAGFLGDSDGPYTLFLYSKGNLVRPEGEPKGHLPFWLPPGLQTPTWDHLPFWPFLFAAHNHTEDVLIGAGPVDERFEQTVKRFTANASLRLLRRVWNWHPIRNDLLKDAALATDMMTRLYMSKHRTVAAEPHLTQFPPPVQVVVPEEGLAWGGFADWQDLGRMYQEKLVMETQANDLLTTRLQRIQDLLSTISSDYHWFWATTSGLIAGAAAFVAMASLAQS